MKRVNMKRALLLVAVLIGMSCTSGTTVQAKWGRGYHGFYGPPLPIGEYPPYRGSIYAQRRYGDYYGYPNYSGYGIGMPQGIGIY